MSQATNHTVKPLKPRPPRYLAPVSQGLVSCQQQSRAKWLHDDSPSFSLLFPFYLFYSSFSLPLLFILFDSFDRELNWIPRNTGIIVQMRSPPRSYEFPASFNRKKEKEAIKRKIERAKRMVGYRGEDGGANRSGSIWLIKLASSLRRGTSYWQLLHGLCELTLLFNEWPRLILPSIPRLNAPLPSF